LDNSYTSSTFPPAFSISAFAFAEILFTDTLIAHVRLPSPSTFTGLFFLLIIECSSNAAFVTSLSHFSINTLRSERFMTLYFVVNLAFEKPFSFGILLKSGVCPPSNH
jgi:hypothetical protein